MEEPLNICIISPEKDAFSETFIRAHAEYLPGNVHFLYGGSLPVFYGEGSPLLKPTRSLYERLKDKICGIRRGHDALKEQALKEYLTSHKIDVVLAEYGPTGHAVKNICRELGIPLTVHFHGYDAYEHAVLKQYNHYESLFDSASAIIAVSRDMHKQLMDLGAPPQKLFHIVYGIDPLKFNGAAAELNPPVFVAVGRFVDKKAPYLTLLAFKDVINYIPDAKLIMAGEGPLLEACRQLAKSLNMTEAVEFRGFCSHEEVASLMRNARGLIQHSLRTTWGDAEGTPLAILEAGATGIPVVATRHGGIPDVVIEGKTGFLVNEGDITAMADAVIKLAQDPQLAGYMGNIAKDYVLKNFSIEQSINQLYEVLKSTVSKEDTDDVMNEPLVSVIIPTFNRALKLPQALRSLQNQTYSNWQAIIVDDGSQDNTKEIVREMASQDERICYVSHPVNKGAQAARNTGVKAALGEWIAFLDSDDQWLPDSLEARMNLLLKEKSSVVHSYAYIVSKNKPMQMYYTPAYRGWVYKELLRKDGPTFPSLIVRKTALEDIGYMDENIESFQEWDTSISLAKSCKFSFLPKPTFIYDYTGEDSISRDLIRSARGYGQIVRKNFWNMLLYGGVGTIGFHYSIMSAFYKNGGDEESFKKYRLKSFGWKIVSPYIVLNKLKHMVLVQ